MTRVITQVTARQLFSASLSAFRYVSSTLYWGRDYSASTGTSESLVHHDGTLTTLSRVAFFWTRMFSTLQHSSTELHACVLKTVLERDATPVLAFVHIAALFLFAHFVAEDIVQVPMTRDLVGL